MMRIEFFGSAACAFKKIGTITGRTEEETMSDLFHVYLWILHEQSRGRKIVSRKDGEAPEQAAELKLLVKLVKNEEAAKEYFEELGWL